MARPPSRSGHSLFGGWAPVTLSNGRVVYRQVLPQSPIRGESGLEGMEPYAPMSRPKGGSVLGGRLNYSPDPRLNAQFSTGPWPLPRSRFTRRELQFLREIGGNEGADYDTVFGKTKFTTPEQLFGKRLTDMTLQEVFAYQDALREETRKAGYGITSKGKVVGTSAVGRGQMQKGTLQDRLADLQITDFAHTKFTPELQDRLIIKHAERSGLDPNRVESWGAIQKARLGTQWESLDVSKGKISPEELEEVLARIKAQGDGRPSKTSRPW